MAEGFITRRGGVAGTAAPSINFVSSTFDSITFTITNNDVLTADIFWEIGDSTPDANTLSLAGGATSSNQVASGLDEETSYTIFAFANAEGKAGSQTSSIAQTTPEEPLLYTAATGGTTEEYNDGGKRYKSHTFTSSGNFVVSQVGNGDRNAVDYLIIAGGGGGGFREGGGGGAGGYRTTLGTSGNNSSAESKVVVTAQSYTVTIGLGGATGTSSVQDGISGQNTSALGITSIGGGGGGGANTIGLNGGSAGGSNLSGSGLGDAANTGTAGQGTAGGRAYHNVGAWIGAGGGGGAGQAGGDALSTGTAGKGGDGLANTLRDGTSETRAGGGGGGISFTSQTEGAGGAGGGGAGSDDNTAAIAGTVNTGSGGGGGGFSSNLGGPGGQGGSGLVVIRYEIAPSI